MSAKPASFWAGRQKLGRNQALEWTFACPAQFPILMDQTRHGGGLANMCRRRWPTFQLCHRMVHDAVAIPLNEVPGVMIVNPPAHCTSQFRQERGVHGAKLCHKVLWLGRCCSRSDSPERERSSFGSRPEAQTGRTASGVPLGDTGTYVFRLNSSIAGRLEDARVPLANDGTRTIRVTFSKTCVMTPETRRNKQRHVC